MKLKREYGLPFIARLAFLFFALIYVPLVIFQCFIIVRSEKKFQVQNNEYYNANTYYCAKRFSEQLDFFQTQAVFMGLEERLKHPLEPDGCTGYPLFETAEFLKTYQTGCSMNKQIGIFYRETDAVISNGHNYSLASFLLMSQHFSEAEYQTLQELFLNNNDSYWFYSNYSPDRNPDRQRLIFGYPICMKRNRVMDAVVFYVMMPNSVNSFLGSGFFNKEFNFALLDEQRNPLFLSNSELSAEFFSNTDADSATCSKNASGDYTIFQYKINGGLEFDTIIRTQVVNGNLQKYSAESLKIILITDALFFIFSLVFILRTNRPLKKLVRGMSKNALLPPQDEFRYIEQVIRQMDRELLEQKQQLVAYVAKDLIEGIPLTPRKEQIAKRDFSFSSYCVMSVTHKNIADKTWEEICAELYESSLYVVCCIQEPNLRRTILICCSQYQTSAGVLQKAFETVIADHCAEPYRIQMGNVVDTYTGIRSSYLSLGPSSGEISADASSPETYAKQEILALLKCVRNGQVQETDSCIDAIFAKISTQNGDVERYVCYDILISLLRELNATKYAPSAEETAKILSFQSSQELRGILLAIASRISEDAQSVDEKSGSHMMKQILHYVDENFTHADICLASVADAFDISIFSLSKIFKQHTGVGFKQYINNKRFSKAHEMLMMTDLPITEIAKSVGYDNPAYFSTIFKAFYGESPSDSRKTT